MKRAIILSIFLIFCGFVLSASVKPSVPDASHLRLMIRKLGVVGGVLYIAAHPDDENTAVLATLSRGELVRTGYLALTRGDGGQNLLGPEQGPLLGLIRTQELLAARNIDGASQFFTRAIDFGYTKSADESFQYWGRDNILSDVVRVIRRFRPDVILCRFPTDGGGHGQHTASAILAVEAFSAAADPNRFPDQLSSLKPWQARRILWNYYNWTAPPSDSEKVSMIPFEAGGYNPFLGLSYTEIAGMSRSMHKSQGFGDSEDRGSYVNYFRPVAGDPAKTSLFDGIDLTWGRIPGSADLQKTLSRIDAEFRVENPAASIPLLLLAKKQMDSIPSNPWVEEKKQDLLEVIRGCAGLWIEAITADESATPGGTVKVSVSAINRSSAALTLDSVEFLPLGKTEILNAGLPNNQAVVREATLEIPANQPLSQPYWFEEEPGLRIAHVANPEFIGLPELPAPLQARITIDVGGTKLAYVVPFLYRRVDPVRGEIYRRFEIVPEAAVNLSEAVLVFAGRTPREVTVAVRAGAAGVAGSVRLNVPQGWVSDPEAAPFELKARNAVQTVRFQITPGKTAGSGVFHAEAVVAGKTLSRGMVTIDYPHIPTQSVFPTAEGKLVLLDLKTNGKNLGYIMGSGDGIPEALRQVGYNVTLLTDETLVGGDLSEYDAIISGVRAYNTREILNSAQPRLLDYVKNGGTFVVQYNTTQELMKEGLGPYPMKISRDRVSVEDAPITFVTPEHPLLNFPNHIAMEDFAGWVQERGLYFPGEWDPQYETILACNDPGEPSKPGGMLYAKYGKGVYIYTAYSWFRELPAGVPGAYRIFVNLISARQ